ncbi:MAG: hypothetical protein ACRDH1_01110 [Actinomycetota bacterium]
MGCVSSKTLLRAAEAYRLAGHHPFAGVETSAGSVDLPALVAQKDELVGTVRREKYLDLVEAYGWELIPGHAEFVGPYLVRVGGRTISAGATTSWPPEPPPRRRPSRGWRRPGTRPAPQPSS